MDIFFLFFLFTIILSLLCLTILFISAIRLRAHGGDGKSNNRGLASNAVSLSTAASLCAAAGLLIVAIQFSINILFISRFLRDDFSLRSVYLHSASTLPWIYKAGASWSSDEGIFLVFTFFLAVVSLFYIYKVLFGEHKVLSGEREGWSSGEDTLFLRVFILYSFLLVLIPCIFVPLRCLDFFLCLTTIYIILLIKSLIFSPL